MSVEIALLLALMVLAASMWLPYVIGVNLHLPDGINAFARPYDNAVLPDWVQRANRAHMNLLEQGMPMAVIVLIGQHLQVTSSITLWTLAVFLALRVIHAVGMTMGWLGYPWRPILFTICWLLILTHAVEIVRLA